MQYTENYEFKLPDGTDKVSVSDLNDNFVEIDGHIKGLKTSYILDRSVQVIDDTTWKIEKWSDGFVRCWCEYTPLSDIECNVEMTTGRYCGTVGIEYPDVFTSESVFVTITPNSLFSVSCTVGTINTNTKKNVSFNNKPF